MTAGLHLISTFGNVGDKKFDRTTSKMRSEKGGELTDVVPDQELLDVIAANKTFVEKLIILSDFQNFPRAVATVKTARDLGVLNGEAVCCA